MTGTNIWMIPSNKYWDHFLEPLKWLKMPACWVFICLKIFLSVKSLFCGVFIYLTCIVTHQTKPMSMGIHHIKGFGDMLIYKTYTRCLKSYTNFWTPCRMNPILLWFWIESLMIKYTVRCLTMTYDQWYRAQKKSLYMVWWILFRCCLPILPQLACSILQTTYKDFFQALYIFSTV